MERLSLKRLRVWLTNNKRIGLLFVGLFLVLMSVSVFSVFFYSKLRTPSHDVGSVIDSNKVSRSPRIVCDNSVITSASSTINSGDINSLHGITQNILKKDSFNLDINCDYILVNYYLQLNDSKNAEKYINEIELLIKSGVKYSDKFSPSAKPPAILRKWLASVKINYNSINNRPIIAPSEVN